MYEYRAVRNGEWKFGSLYEEDGRHWIITRMGESFSANTVDSETVGMKSPITAVDERPIYEGDIVSFISKEQIGERRVSKRRGYYTYAEYGEVEIRGVVRFGTIKEYPHENIPLFYIDTEQSVAYNTYFWGSGNKSDRPELYKKNLIKPLFTNKKYEIVGNIHDQSLGEDTLPHRG